ncbi:hypothetical protein TNIN_384041 [Trichonephila inaurata madagascariensis]|uniref:Uncharacterized protein n=1 Tax=Trichonephila inaurata madagascariensis TaxID=2747483 RepID=A0A8X6Y6N5_9ARAC|nr:hypothetical protein TNIN_384041 [Trichonephila inaurata madagascariensis]
MFTRTPIDSDERLQDTKVPFNGTEGGKAFSPTYAYKGTEEATPVGKTEVGSSPGVSTPPPGGEEGKSKLRSIFRNKEIILHPFRSGVFRINGPSPSEKSERKCAPPADWTPPLSADRHHLVSLLFVSFLFAPVTRSHWPAISVSPAKHVERKASNRTTCIEGQVVTTVPGSSRPLTPKERKHAQPQPSAAPEWALERNR